MRLYVKKFIFVFLTTCIGGECNTEMSTYSIFAMGQKFLKMQKSYKCRTFLFYSISERKIFLYFYILVFSVIF